MKKLGNIILQLWESILAFVVTIVLAIWVIVVCPFDYIKYKRSLYYKKTRRKYKLYAAQGVKFDIYNEILKNDLPIHFIENPNNDSLEAGWLVFRDTLIIPNVFSFAYSSQTGEWSLGAEEADGEEIAAFSLDAYLESEVKEANELAGRTICKDAIVLLASDGIENTDMAKKERRFLVYEDSREEVLKQFCQRAGQ